MAYGEDERPMVGGMYRSKNRRCCVVTTLSVTLAIILVLAIAIPVGVHNSRKGDHTSQMNAACDATTYPDLCRQQLQGSDGSFCGMAQKLVTGADASFASMQNSTTESGCAELFQIARGALSEVLNATCYGNAGDKKAACDDVQSKLSAAQTTIGTCNNNMQELALPQSDQYNNASEAGFQLISIFLAITNVFCTGLPIPQSLEDLFPSSGGRRLLELDDTVGDIAQEVEFPTWMDRTSRRHLLSRPSAYNVIVAADGSGTYRRVMDAINAVPKSWYNNNKRYVIYVKAGVYNEQIIVPTHLTNLVIIGDGIDRTIFTGNRNVALMKGMTTFASGTLLVGGKGFLGKFFTVRNTAGSLGQQACAARVSADLVAFYQVKFDSFQDTLYAHAFRQFYSQCVIQGTVDFMFGNANAVFQSCQLVAKKTALQGQQNTYTAQGKTDPHQNTGLAYQDCNFVADPYLAQAFPTGRYLTYLGRPWKEYSTCVLLRATLQSHIDPTGWLPWNTSSYGLYTSYFAEYHSKGPASNPAKRVKWSHQITNPAIANRYQAGSFINGKAWLPSLGIPYSLASV